MIRRIIRIDEEKCNGCGLCARACHEGAIDIVDGKAKLMRENFCDGFGDCLPNCPMGAITFEEREAPEYDAAAVALAKTDKGGKNPAEQIPAEPVKEGIRPDAGEAPFAGCPGSRMRTFMRPGQAPVSGRAPFAGQNPGRGPAQAFNDAPSPDALRRHVLRRKPEREDPSEVQRQLQSQLRQWPVQIRLLPEKAPFFEGAKLLIAADCTAYAYANMHDDFIRGHVTLVGCPKLDPVDYTEKLTRIIAGNDIRSVTIVRMEVPCCGGLQRAAENALKTSGKFLPWRVVTISCEGEILDD